MYRVLTAELGCWEEGGNEMKRTLKGGYKKSKRINKSKEEDHYE